MKLKKLSILLLLAVLPVLTYAQKDGEYAVPLSNPGEAGSLELGLIYGSISVTGYDGKDVIVKFASEQDEDSDDKSGKKNGMRRIRNSSAGLEITEKDNKVRVSVSWNNRNSNIAVMVPTNFSLKLSTVNSGDIKVENVAGSHEVSNVNGDIEMINVSGDAIVNTVNGEIDVVFDSIDPESPMSFTTVNGDVDLSLPADSKFDVRLKSEWGEIYSDFDFEAKQESKAPEATRKQGELKIIVDNWVTGSINGGGPEYLIKSLRGDILIRKK